MVKTTFGILAIAAITLASQVQAQNAPTNGLVAYYPFNGNASDESGFGNNGSVSGAQPGIDRFGHANVAYGFQQDQLNYIQAAGTNIPRGLGARTFSIWFRQSPRLVGDQLYAPLFSLWDGLDSTKAFVVEFWINSLQVKNMGSPGALYKVFDSAGQPMVDGQWHQLVLTVVSNDVAGYLDARPIVWSNEATSGAQWSLPQGGLWIGSEYGQYYDGQLDDLRVYDRGLSPAEVSQLYSSEAPGSSGPPVITDQPRDQFATPGDEAYFSVAASGQSPLLRQWRFNGFSIPGATSPILKITNVQASNDGLYSLVLSNASGSLTSSVARLTVLTSPPGTVAPTNGLVAYYTFSGNANDDSGFGDHGVVRGAQSSADRFGQANLAYSFDQYQMNYIRASGTKVPRGFGVRTFSLWFRQTPRIVGDTLHAPMVSLWDEQDPNQTFAIEFWGNSLQIWNSGSYGATYKAYSSCGTCPGQPMANGQWHQLVCVVSSNIVTAYLDALPVVWSGGLPLPGAQWSLPQGRLWIGGSPGQYYDGQMDDLRIYDRALSQAEVFQLYSVETPTNGGPPLIVAQPQNQTVPLTSSTYLEVVANGKKPLLCQWRFNAVNLSGATNSVVQLTNLQAANDGLYSVVLSNSVSAVTSSVARLTVLIPIPGGQPPTNGLVAYYPLNGNANDQLGLSAPGAVSAAVPATNRFGNTNGCYLFNPTNQAVIVFPESVLPRGTQPATIAFWVKQTPRSPGGLAGLLQMGDAAQGTNWVFELLYDWGVRPVLEYIQGNVYEGLFTCYALNPGFTQYLDWEHIVLTFNSNSVPTMYVNGEYLPFSNFPSPGTVWSRPAGSLRLGDGFPGLIDDVRIYNRALSEAEVLQLYAAEVPPPPTITAQPQSVSSGVGKAAAFSATATGVPPVTYQWRRDGIALPLATSDTLTLTNLQPQNAGNYQVVASNPYGSVTSSVAVLSLTNLNSTLWQGLVAYYPFNGNADDQSGFGDHGVVLGATLAADRAGVPNSAYDFVATNHATITASGFSLPRADASRTLSFWFKARPVNSQVATVEYPVGWGSFGYPGAAFAAVLTSSGAFGVAGNSATVRDASFRPLDNVWHYAVLAFAGGTNCSGFIDGFKCNFGNTAPAALWNTASGSLTIGSLLNGGWFDGQVDDIRIYNRALSTTEAQELYVEEVGSGPRITNIVSASVSLGQPATLSILATGGQPLSYQWYDRYDNVVAGATNASLTIVYPCATNLGQYRVVVSNAWGLASAPATLTVADPYSPVYLPLPNILPGTERVTLLPNGDLELVGGISAAGDLLATNWNLSGRLTLGAGSNTTLANGSYVSMAYITAGLTSSSRYQTIPLEPNTEYVLSGYVWNMGDATNNVNTALDATDVIWDPQINFGPQYSHADQGYFVYCKFHSAASGTNVQIRAFYGVFTGTGAAAGYYPLAAQWDNIAVTKASEFVPPTITVPILVSQPVDRTVVATSSLEMAIQAQSTLPVSYQWFKDGRALSAATSRLLTLANVGAQDAGTYTVVVTNAYGAITSSPARLTVQALTIPGVLAGPITNLANGHVYYVLKVSSWVEAQQAAVKLGGNLATIRNADEQQWIWRTCSALDTSHYFWIGLYDADPFVNSTNLLERRNEFRWVSGEPVPYSNWLAVEPNNWGERGEFYGTLYPANDANAGYWNDMYEDLSTRGPGIAEVIPPPAITAGPVSQSVARGAQVTLSATVTGGLPFAYQWRKDGLNIPGATNATFTISEAQLNDAGAYKLVVSNPSGEATSIGAVLTVLTPLTLPEALNAVGYWWTTGGNSLWVPQTNVTADGISAGVSGVIADNQQTWAEMIVNGPGQLSFKWKVSSEFGFDALSFEIDGTEKTSVSGETTWLTQNLSVPAGNHRLRWVYEKDGSESVGQDRAWLDLVTYVPDPGVLQPVYMQTPKLRQADGLFQIDLLGEAGKTIGVEVSTNLRNWSLLTTVTNALGTTQFADPTSGSTRLRFYRIRTP